ncbi:MAG: proton-conducting membrane transporter [Defluviitaleaceae bacterium]|nr:proton-conducting membrane transporter [Defluviitaleaceae bacterium]
MLTYYVIAPILLAVFLYFFSDRKTGRFIAFVGQLALTGAAVYLFIQAQGGEVLTNIGNFRGYTGIYLRADALSAVFVLLTTLTFLCAAIYSHEEDRSNLYWFLLFIWQGALIGLFLTRDFFNVFVLIEVATVIVAVLLMYSHGKRNMYDGMLFLMSNIIAVQFYLFGLGYIYMITGVLDMEAAARIIENMEQAQLALPYALIMTAIAFKCAILPLSSWFVKVSGVPRAPISIAAILSAIHVKTGIYLFIRFQEVFGAIAAHEFFLVVGIITGIVGVIMALAQKDIMLLLAYSSVAQVGLILVGLSQQYNDYALAGSLFHIVNHALFKAALFFGAGMISEIYNTRDIAAISGVWRQDKIIGISQILAILGIIGAPLFNGSISKYFISTQASTPVFILMILINLGTILVFLKYSQMLFGKKPKQLKGEAIQKDKYKQFVTIILSAMCLVFGLGGQQLVEILFGMDVTVSTRGYLEKIGLFAISLIVGYFISRKLKITNPLPALVGKLDFSFRGISASIGIFFALLLLTVGFLI